MNYELAIDPAIKRLYPDYQCLVIYAEALINHESNNYSMAVLRAAEENARSRFTGDELVTHAHLQAWRDAFRKFGAKPKRYFCGAEALLRRALTGAELPAINPVVNLYNAVSIKRVIPIGGEDWDQLASDLRLIPAQGDEPFVTSSPEGEQTVYPSPGEIIWADTAGATVRRWNWRQCVRTRITSDTQNAYFVLDTLLPFTSKDLLQAGDELMGHLASLSPEAKMRSELLG